MAEDGNWWDVASERLRDFDVKTAIGNLIDSPFGTQPALRLVPKGEGEEGLDVPVGGTDVTSDKAVTKALYYQTIGPDAAFAQFINWMFRNAVFTLTPQMQSRDGGIVPAGQQIRDQLAPQGGAVGGIEGSRSQLLNLRDMTQRAEAIGFLGNIEVTELSNRTLSLAGQRVQEVFDWINQGTALAPVDSSEWGLSLPTNWSTQELSEGSKRYEEDVKKMIEENYELSGMSDEQKAKFLSPETLNMVLANLHEEATNGFLSEMAQESPLMMLGSLTDPVTGAGSEFAFVHTYNGTPYGQIETIYDLFSGGMIGPFNVAPLLKNLYEETKDSSGYSEVLNRLQSELYAWGYIDSVEQWGHLEPIVTDASATVDALSRFQTELYLEAMTEQEALGENQLISADMTPRVDRVIDRMIDKRLSGGPTLMASDIESRLINKVANQVENSMMGASDDAKHMVTQVIRDMDPRRQEALYGSGGSTDEVRLMDHMLSGFYGTPDWATKVDWNADSANGKTANYRKYGVRTGAIGNLDDDELSQTEDITRATLRQIIARDVEDLQTITEEQIANALTTYGETAGLRNNMTEGKKFTRDDYLAMARSVHGNWSGVRYETDPNEQILQMRAKQALHGSGDSRALSSAISRLTPRGSNRVRV